MSNHEITGRHYLEEMVKSAPPARLRLLMIERGVELCRSISSRWKPTPPSSGCDEQTLHLADILTELLSGVESSDLPIAKQVSDLYVFLIQHLVRAEAACDASMIDELQLVLETEAETWRAVCAQSSLQKAEEKSVSPAAPHFRSPQPIDRAALAGSLNLQG
jgi:flagellar secretion chaperone FliS